MLDLPDVADHQVMIGRQFCIFLTRTSNTDWNNAAETVQQSMSGHWPNEPLLQVYSCKYLL